MNTEVIDRISEQDNYSDSAFLARGLNPSDGDAILVLEMATKKFLAELKSGLETSDDIREFVSKQVDDLPWFNLDTEEKEFLADVLAPAIESIGLDPWKIF